MGWGCSSPYTVSLRPAVFRHAPFPDAALLTLVRHGQASYLAANYDQLSETGERQSHCLAEHWSARQFHVDRVFHGPAVRQRRTSEIVAAAMRRAGHPWPEPGLLPEWDEFQGIEMMKAFTPVLVQQDDAVRAANEAFVAARGTSDAAPRLDRLFQLVSLRWIEGTLEADHIEPWAVFLARIERALAALAESAAPGSHTVVFTSGGCIAAAVRAALAMTPRATMELVWTVRNGSLSELLLASDGLRLHQFNAVPHLEDGSLLSYR